MVGQFYLMKNDKRWKNEAIILFLRYNNNNEIEYGKQGEDNLNRWGIKQNSTWK